MSAKVNVRVTAKRCRCCGEMVAAGEFYSHRHTRGGLQSWCKACSRKSSRRSALAHGCYRSELTPAQRAKWAEIARQNAAERDA